MMEWIAFYKDKTRLHQFEGEKENLFRDIDQDKLEIFTISKDSNYITINLTNGVFEINGVELNIPKLSNREEKYRLIYFRRVAVSLGTDGSSDRTTESFIGFQVTIDDKNHKAMISEKNGKFNIHVE